MYNRLKAQTFTCHLKTVFSKIAFTSRICLFCWYENYDVSSDLGFRSFNEKRHSTTKVCSHIALHDKDLHLDISNNSITFQLIFYYEHRVSVFLAKTSLCTS